MQALSQLKRAHALGMVHGSARVGLKSLPPVNQVRVPEACQPEAVAQQWLDRFLSASSRACEVGEGWGGAARYNARLVSEHSKRCAACAREGRCRYGDLLYLWVTYGVDLRVLCTQAEPSQYTRRAIVQAERAEGQLEHLQALSANGVVQQCPRKDVACVGNVFLVGVKERASGMGGVEKVAEEAGQPEVVQTWSGAVQSSAKERLVMDLRGLNRVTQSWDFQYDSLLRVASRYEPGDQLAVLDLSSAFHLIPVAKEAWPLLGLRVRESYWRCTRLPFGYSAAPAICSIVTGELARLVEQLEKVKAVCCYVDDYFVLLKSNTDQEYVDEIITYLGTMGAMVSPMKCQFGTEVTFVGFKVRGTPHGLEISMREEKRARLRAELESMIPLIKHDTGGALEAALEMLGGRLQWYWPALSNSYAWLEPLHHWRRHAVRLSTMNTDERERLQGKLEQALRWWLAKVRQAVGRWSAIGHTEYAELAVVDASGPSASGEFSVGGILWRRVAGAWQQAQAWPGQTHVEGSSTQAAEIAAILEAWKLMESPAGLVVSDSTAAVTAAARGYTRNYGSLVNETLRDALEQPGQLRRVLWTPREHNTAADALSRPQEP